MTFSLIMANILNVCTMSVENCEESIKYSKKLAYCVVRVIRTRRKQNKSVLLSYEPVIQCTQDNLCTENLPVPAMCCAAFESRAFQLKFHDATEAIRSTDERQPTGVDST